MNAATLMEALINVGVKIDNLWSMFIGVQLAIFWMIIMIPRPLLLFERFVAFGALAIFCYINGRSLQLSYDLLNVIRIELAETTGGALAKHPLLNAYIQGLDFSDREVMLMATHGGALIVVGLIITFQSTIYRSYMKSVEKHTPDSVNKLTAP